jgi:hypothetical protein
VSEVDAQIEALRHVINEAEQKILALRRDQVVEERRAGAEGRLQPDSQARRVLDFIRAAPSALVSPKEVATGLNISTSLATVTLHRLVKRGLATSAARGFFRAVAS